MKIYRITIVGTRGTIGYVKGILFNVEKGFEVIATINQEDAAWYEEDKAKFYCEELNGKSKDINFKMEEVEENDRH